MPAGWRSGWIASARRADVVALSLTGEFMARAILEQGAKVRSLSLISPTGMGVRAPPTAAKWVTRGSVPVVAVGWPAVVSWLLTSKLPSIRWFLGKAFVGAERRSI